MKNQQPAVRVADAPQPLPALLAGTTGTLPFPGLPRAVFGTALDRTPLLLTVVGRTPALPRAMGDGVLVDLRLMQRLSDAAATAPDQEVWTTAAAAPRIQRALAGQGVRVTGRETLAEWQQRYGSAAGPVSARLAQVSGGAALLLAVVVCVGLRVIGGGARRRQWASYRSAGVGDGRLRRLVALEFLLPALGGCALGALAGLAAFALARSRLPLFDTSGGVPPVSLVPPWTLAGVVLLTAGLLAAAALLIARLETAPEARG